MVTEQPDWEIIQSSDTINKSLQSNSSSGRGFIWGRLFPLPGTMFFTLQKSLLIYSGLMQVVRINTVFWKSKGASYSSLSHWRETGESSIYKNYNNYLFMESLLWMFEESGIQWFRDCHALSFSVKLLTQGFFTITNECEMKLLKIQ